MRQRFRLWGMLALAGAASAWAIPPCLSVSPLRALRGTELDADTASQRELRRKLVDSLRVRLEPQGWLVRAAGECPENGPVLDLFQNPGDLEVLEQVQVRSRLEWRHEPGPAIIPLEPFQGDGPDLGAWASVMELVARTQMMAQLHLAGATPKARVTLNRESPGMELPFAAALPPGALHLEVQAPRCEPWTLDTSLVAGNTLDLDVVLRRRRWKPSPWPAVSLSVASFVVGGIYAVLQERASDRYHALGASDPDALFESRWKDLRHANQMRNGFALSGVVLAALAGGIAISW